MTANLPKTKKIKREPVHKVESKLAGEVKLPAIGPFPRVVGLYKAVIESMAEAVLIALKNGTIL